MWDHSRAAGGGTGVARSARLRATGRTRARRTTLCALIGAVSLAWAGAVRAQAGGPSAVRPDSVQLVDRVAAIVGDTVVLLSEVQQEILRLQSQGAKLPPRGSADFQALVRQILSAMVDQLLLFQEAKRAGIEVQDDDADRLTEEYFQQRRSLFSSEDEFQKAVEATGQNMFQYRQSLRAQARAEIMLQRYQRSLQTSGKLPPVDVSEAEIRQYFQANASREVRPATVSLNRLVLAPEPSESALDSASEVLKKAAEEILEDGEDFEVVARRYSQDPASRDQGGQLGWLRRNEVVPAFGDAAWYAAPGRIIGPVKTRFGLHLIKVQNVRGGERNLSHILVKPTITQADVELARQRAEALRDSLVAGVDAEHLKDQEGVLDEPEVRYNNVVMDQIAGRFGPEYRARLVQPRAGEVIGPFEVPGDAGVVNFAVVQVIDYRPEGQFQLDDVRDNIRQALRGQKQMAAYLDKLREETFIKILLF